MEVFRNYQKKNVIVLTGAEAQVLVDVLGKIGGPLSSGRKVTEAIYTKLRELGIMSNKDKFCFGEIDFKATSFEVAYGSGSSDSKPPKIIDGGF